MHTHVDTGLHTTCAHSHRHTHHVCTHSCAGTLAHTLVFTLEGSGRSLLIVVQILVAIPPSVCCVLILGGPGIRGILFLREDARLVFSDHERTPVVAANLTVG